MNNVAEVKSINPQQLKLLVDTLKQVFSKAVAKPEVVEKKDKIAKKRRSV